MEYSYYILNITSNFEHLAAKKSIRLVDKLLLICIIHTLLHYYTILM